MPYSSSSRQLDFLVGADPDQPDLFGSSAVVTDYRPSPAQIRSRLEIIVTTLREAQALPWDQSQTRLYQAIVPDITRRLPEDEAARWREAFDRELARLTSSV